MLLGTRSSPARTLRNGSEIKDFIVAHLQHTSRSFLILAAGLIATFSSPLAKGPECFSQTLMCKVFGSQREICDYGKHFIEASGFFYMQNTGFFSPLKYFPPLGYYNH